jgi:hypothetical protein
MLMTETSVNELSVHDERFQTILARHRAFWERAEEDSILYATFQSARSAPLPFVLRQSDGSYVTDAECLEPHMIDVAAMIDEVANWEPCRLDGMLRSQGQWLLHAGVGDTIPFSGSPPKIPWVEAMLGCPIKLVDGEIWIEPYPGDPEDVIRRGANFEHNPWFQLYLEFLRQLQARISSRFPVTANALIRGVGDLAAAVMGVQEACLAWIERPRLMARLLRVCTDGILQMVEAGYKVLRPFQNGYPSVYGIWAPGPVVSTQDDHSSLLSPKMYREQLLPYAQEVIRACPFSIFHLHSPGLHIAPLLLDLPELDVIEVGIDSPPAQQRRPYEVQMLQMILENKALIVDAGPPNVESLDEYEELLAQLPERGLCFRVAFEPAVYGALPPDFPGCEVWLLG